MCGAEAARERREGCVQRRGGGVAAALRRRCGGKGAVCKAKWGMGSRGREGTVCIDVRAA